MPYEVHGTRRCCETRTPGRGAVNQAELYSVLTRKPRSGNLLQHSPPGHLRYRSKAIPWARYCLCRVFSRPEAQSRLWRYCDRWWSILEPTS